MHLNNMHGFYILIDKLLNLHHQSFYPNQSLWWHNGLYHSYNLLSLWKTIKCNNIQYNKHTRSWLSLTSINLMYMYIVPLIRELYLMGIIYSTCIVKMFNKNFEVNVCYKRYRKLIICVYFLKLLSLKIFLL